MTRIERTDSLSSSVNWDWEKPRNAIGKLRNLCVKFFTPCFSRNRNRSLSIFERRSPPLNSRNAEAINGNRIQARGQSTKSEQKQLVGDGAVKTGQSRDNVTTSKIDASVKTVVQRPTKELNAKGARPKRKKTKTLDIISSPETKEKAKKLINKIFNQYKEKPDPLSCKLDDFIMYQAVRSLALREELPGGLGKVLSDENQPDEVQLNALKTWIGDNKDELIKKLPYEDQHEITKDIMGSMDKSKKHAKSLIKDRKGAENDIKTYLKLVREISTVDKATNDIQLTKEDKKKIENYNLAMNNKKMINKLISESIPMIEKEVVKIKEMIKHIEENKICVPNMILVLQHEMEEWENSIGMLKGLPDSFASNTSSSSGWV